VVINLSSFIVVYSSLVGRAVLKKLVRYPEPLIADGSPSTLCGFESGYGDQIEKVTRGVGIFCFSRVSRGF
ncbi:hypothetical protein ACFL1J_05405, partial [Pseudomonadota bacterium]